MCKKFGLVVVALVVVFGMQVAPTQASEVDDKLKRLDELIKEMLQIRLELQALVSTAPASTPTPAVLGATDSNEPVFTLSLANGETNEDIRRIQKLLATDPAVYPYGVSSGFYGPKTEEAIRNLQTKFDLKAVGVIGPATTALLEKFFRKYPDENFPADALAAVPQVAGASTTVSPDSAADTLLEQVRAAMAAQTGQSTSNSTAETGSLKITVDVDDEEGEVRITHENGSKEKMTVEGESQEEMIEQISLLSDDLSESEIEDVVKFTGDDLDEKSDNDAEEEDAEDALEDAEDEIDDAKDEIEEADDDGDDVDWAEDTLDEAKDALEEAEEAYDDEDWDEAVEKAEEAEELAEEAVDRIDEEEDDDEDGDDIRSIEAEIDEEDEAKITVEYKGDKDDETFTVDEDKIDNIIEKVADELDLDEDVVEDLIEYDFGSVDYIDLRDEDDDERLVIVYYTSGVDRRFTIDDADEDEMIEDIADEIDEDEDDIEDWLD